MNDDTDCLFTAADRRQTCIHEAAHAVIYAFGGAFVSEMAVRPEGPGAWQHTSKRGSVRTDINGICRAELPHSAKSPYVFWDEDSYCMSVNRTGYKKYIQTRIVGKKSLMEERRWIRSGVCAALAGPIADAISDSVEIALAPECNEIGNNDICDAEALCMLLPWRNEYDFLAIETERLLRTPEIWKRVQDLAAALEVAGTLGNVDDIPFLPDPIPNWPPTPYRRNKHD
ncbi:MAG: hypothetical protein A2X82_15525 [Geobacteraceae bacterium GWC2_55_20]|nr:MAG: hypothetical protein A2X82_15525 [Geobacteraceae bacterium GWC2_55_20]OGU22347.1 MAG: hypothetical protein A2X85_13585 [Geobacteraceae bacterium GWF2_54_21]HCE68190.1 hypothetical protein [Geobacter sp.]